MQRYLRKILKCAMDKSRELRYAAFEVVTTIVQQGLAHPVLVCKSYRRASSLSDKLIMLQSVYAHYCRSRDQSRPHPAE